MKTKKFILISVLLWIFPLIFFWTVGRSIYPLYFVIFLYGWYPVLSSALSFVIGRWNLLGKLKWIIPLLVAFANAWGYPLTFGFSNTMTTGRIHLVELSWILAYAVCAYIGFLLGVVDRIICNRKDIRS